MALVTLVIQDAQDGMVNVQAFSEPTLQSNLDGELTKAQAALLVALNAIDGAAKQGQAEAPRILLAGQDELPH